ncbi:MAG: hypothetical protein ACTTI8_01985 [Prevotella intermedia]
MPCAERTMLSVVLRSSGVKDIGFFPHEISRKKVEINATHTLKKE